MFLYRYRMLLLLVLVLSIAATVIITYLTEPEYQSTGIIFPTPTNSPEKILTEPQFGYEVDADWLLQVLKSDIVRDTLNAAFDLMAYFEIDPTKPQWIDEYRNKYHKLVDFNRTRYMSIEITATTSDPELSAKIVNAIIDKINPIREGIFKNNTYQSMIHYEQAYFQKNDLINRLVDSIHNLRQKNTNTSLDLLYKQIKAKKKEVDGYREELNKIRNDYNFYDLESYMGILNSNLAEARSIYTLEKGKYQVYLESAHRRDTLIINSRARMEGALANIRELEAETDQLDNIKRRYGELSDLLNAGIDQLRELNKQYENMANAFEPFVNSIRLERLTSDYAHEQVLLNEIRYKYEGALQSYKNPIPAVYVINRAQPSYEKASPSLLVNGLLIVPPTLILVLGLLLLLEKWHSLKKYIHESGN
jgi:uncharacterized protein involved in exopolysaccharide biosynthesis